MKIWIGAGVAAFALVASLTAQAPAAAPSDPRLHDELVEMGRVDQVEREGLAAAVSANNTEYLQRLIDADTARTERLKAIVADHAWPTSARVGRDGVAAAWLVLQHTPDTDWQEAMLPAVERAADAGDVRKEDLALLIDRVLVRNDQPQRYGASFHIADGRLVADALEDPAHVDERRATMNLPPMSEYVKLLREMYKMPVEWPPKKQ